MPIADDHETRISRLEFRMDIIADKQERDSSERKEEYGEIIRELKALRDKNQISLWHHPWAVVVLGIGLPFDAALNVVAGLYWREPPRWRSGEVLLTARLQRWVKDSDYPARQRWARRVCAILNKHDKGHC